MIEQIELDRDLYAPFFLVKRLQWKPHDKYVCSVDVKILGE